MPCLSSLIKTYRITGPVFYVQANTDINVINVNKKIWLDLVELLLCSRF